MGPHRCKVCGRKEEDRSQIWGSEGRGEGMEVEEDARSNCNAGVDSLALCWFSELRLKVVSEGLTSQP